MPRPRSRSARRRRRPHRQGLVSWFRGTLDIRDEARAAFIGAKIAGGEVGDDYDEFETWVTDKQTEYREWSKRWGAYGPAQLTLADVLRKLHDIRDAGAATSVLTDAGQRYVDRIHQTIDDAKREGSTIQAETVRTFQRWLESSIAYYKEQPHSDDALRALTAAKMGLKTFGHTAASD